MFNLFKTKKTIPLQKDGTIDKQKLIEFIRANAHKFSKGHGYASTYVKYYFKGHRLELNKSGNPAEYYYFMFVDKHGNSISNEITKLFTHEELKALYESIVNPINAAIQKDVADSTNRAIKHLSNAIG